MTTLKSKIEALENDVNGLFFGNPKQLFIQVVGVVVVALYSFVISLVLLKVVDALVGLRVQEEGEIEGLDIDQHGEEGYFL